MSPATSLTVPYSPFYKNYGLNKNNLQDIKIYIFINYLYLSTNL